MALVFKIKFDGILRRWLVSEDFNAIAFSVTLSQLEDKIRELFHTSPTASLLITYVDKENDVVTLGDDQDLVDACLVQQLNPLRLDVCVKEIATQEAAAMPSPTSSEVGNLDIILKGFSPQATADNLKKIVKASTDGLGPKHLAGFLGGNLKKGHLAGGLPNAGMGSVVKSVVPPHLPVPPNLRAFGGYHVFHSGVQCDGCGMNPIEGPRYKSTKVLNYDLCFGCYDLMGTEADFERLEHPSNSHGHSLFFDRGSRPSAVRTWMPSFPEGMYAWTPECPFSGQAMDLSLYNDRHKKLDARFVKDVTVFDGTQLGPGMKFTKIWCMENTGSLPWPQGTQLAHVAGDALSSMEVVNVELPDGGLPCGEEVEISLNLRAPEVEGRYVSHWRLLSPSGWKFGHRVWVMIQVISEGDMSVKEDESFVNVNIGQYPNEGILEKGMFPFPSKLNCEISSPSNAMETCDKGDVLNNQGNQPVPDTEMDIELDGFSVVEKPVEIAEFEMHASPAVEEMTEASAETQLKALESLGFDDRELNLYWLKKNNGSIRGTVEDLLVCAGWEEAIRNLKEMGFDDQPSNIRLLHKYKGSIKLVVKDLVKMEKQKTSQQM